MPLQSQAVNVASNFIGCIQPGFLLCWLINPALFGM
jgi:hypothetical protein